MNWIVVLSFIATPLCPEREHLALFRQWSKSPSPELRVQAVRVLRGHGGRESRAAILSMLADSHPAVRASAREELRRRAPEEGADLLKEIAQLRPASARIEGLRVILARGEDPAPLATDRDAEVRARALASGRVAAPVLRRALADSSPKVRALALEQLRDAALAAQLAADRSEEVRIAAARVARDAGTIARLLADRRSWRVRLAAVRAAERLRLPALVPDLIGVLDGRPGRVRARAAEVLERLTQAPFGEDAKRWRAWWSRSGSGYVFPTRREKPVHRHSSARVSFRRIPVSSRRVCFVLDASRSMDEPAPGGGGRSRWELVVRDLLGVLGKLPKDTRFNVVLFRTDVEAWRPRLVPITAGTRNACRRWIEQAKPAGWTNLYDAVATALADDEVDALYVLTDGVPSRGAETVRTAILREVAYLNHFRLVQINCVQAGGSEGLGKRWEGFLEELARAHDGVSVRE